MKNNYLLTRITTILLILSGCLLSTGVLATDGKADLILKNMSEYLKTATQFSFHADITYESVYTENEKIQYGAVADISLLRPEYARSVYSGDERTSQIFYNGKTISYFDKKRNVYAVVKSPGEIDTALDNMLNNYGITMPFADLLYSNPHAVLTEEVITGSLVGLHTCGGQRLCHHLSFTQESIDWQIWIEEGSQPLPLKLVITHKLEPGSPQFVVRLSKWNFKPGLSKNDFNFNPPHGASKIQFLVDWEKENMQ